MLSRPRDTRRLAGALAALILAVLFVRGAPQLAAAGASGEIDTALVVSVDVSNSVDDHRYQLQMEGIAKALEDPVVIDAILNGPHGGILFSMISWADKPQVSIPWRKIASKEDALATAAIVRKLPQQGGEFTCLAGMLRMVSDKVIPQVPMKATRVVIDVSGDGADNCNAKEPPAALRDEIVGYGATINGLPILEGNEAATLEDWYRNNVMGGNGAFVLPAQGFEDFGNAIRQKFVIEISGRALPGRQASAASGGN